MTNLEHKGIMVAGFCGLAAAILVGLGENMIQFLPGGDYTDPSYGYFAQIAPERQTIGHFLSVLAAPLYLVGYWHFCQMLKPANKNWAKALFLICAYAFVIGTAWMGGRIYLALVAHEMAAGHAGLDVLLANMADHNEPLVNVLRIAVVTVSIIWIALVLTGRTYYPKWMALANPAVVLGLIFGIYFIAPTIGSYILPAAMNVTHVLLFSLSLFFAMRLKATTVESFKNADGP